MTNQLKDCRFAISHKGKTTTQIIKNQVVTFLWVSTNCNLTIILVITLKPIDLIPTFQLRVTLGCKKARKLVGSNIFDAQAVLTELLLN